MTKHIYEVKLIASNTETIVPEYVVKKFEVETSDICRTITHTDWRDILAQTGRAIKNLGAIYEMGEDYALIGHEGSECGNIKTLCQFEVEWKFIC